MRIPPIPLNKAPATPHYYAHQSTRPSTFPLQPGYSLTLTMSAEDRNVDDKLDILEMSGLQGSQSFTLLPGGGQPPEGMMAFLRLMQLNGGCLGSNSAACGVLHLLGGAQVDVCCGAPNMALQGPD